MTAKFRRAWALWREAVRYEFPVLLVAPSCCTFVERDGARFGAGIL